MQSVLYRLHTCAQTLFQLSCLHPAQQRKMGKDSASPTAQACKQEDEQCATLRCGHRLHNSGASASKSLPSSQTGAVSLAWTGPPCSAQAPCHVGAHPGATSATA